ncbi:hypothetical protein HDU96_001458 [Phlyctochytrium bullatum]|nr:hypothetical protein HDU96_001458 [Phlyctochytrium bullatum]
MRGLMLLSVLVVLNVRDVDDDDDDEVDDLDADDDVVVVEKTREEERPSWLYFGDSFRLSSETGVQQGDPLGPLLFAMVLRLLLTQVKDLCDLDFSAAFLDHWTIAGRHASLLAAVQCFAELGPPLG